MTETVIPGVGLWTASERRLEGSPERVRLYNLKETVNHLILNVHDPAEIRETLRTPVFSDIEKLEINYFDGCAFPGFAWALQLTVVQPKEITVRGLDEPMETWQYLCLWDTCRATYQASINDISAPIGLQPGVVLSGGWDEWYRIFPDGRVAVPSFYTHLVPRRTQKLIVDMEETETPFSIPELVKELTIWSMPRRSFTDVLTIVRTRNLKKLTIGARRGVLGLREVQALQARCPKVEHWT